MKNDTLCFHCCHPFSTKCLQMPIKYDDNTYYTSGSYCSWECLKAYIIHNNDDSKFGKFTLFTHMRTSLGLHDEISEAPPRETLKAFGGKLTIQEFRKNNEKILALPHPMIQLNPFIEKNTNVSCVSTDDAKRMYENTDLKLKRKQEKSSANILEKTMGLIKQDK